MVVVVVCVLKTNVSGLGFYQRWSLARQPTKASCTCNVCKEKLAAMDYVPPPSPGAMINPRGPKPNPNPNLCGHGQP